MPAKVIRTAEQFEAFVRGARTSSRATRCSIQGEAREIAGAGNSFDLVLPRDADAQDRMMRGTPGAVFDRVRVFCPQPVPGLAAGRVTTVVGAVRHSVPFDLQIVADGEITQSRRGKVSGWQENQHRLFRQQTPSGGQREPGPGELGDALAAGRRILWVGRREIRAYDDFFGGELGRYRHQVDTADAPMSGPDCVAKVCAALREADPSRIALIVISRGGGDVAGLASFHDADLLQAVASSPIPVAVAIGHRQDHFPLQEVAACCAATPSELGNTVARAIAAPASSASAASTSTAAPAGPAPDPVPARPADELADLRVAHESLTRERDALVQERDELSARLAQDARAAARDRIVSRDRGIGVAVAVLGLLLAAVLAGWSAQSPAVGVLPAVAVLVLTGAATLWLLVVTPRRIDRRPPSGPPEVASTDARSDNRGQPLGADADRR